MSHTTLPATRKPWRTATIALSLAVSVVFLNASPAAAVGNTGEALGGSGQEDSITYGQDYGAQTGTFCMEVTASSYTVNFTGSQNLFTADDGSDTATYTGPATLTYSTTETYFIGPEGTYTHATMQDGCDASTLGAPIDATVSVSGSDMSGSIACGPDDAEYAREGDVVTLDWEGACTVTDSGGAVSTPATTDHSYSATLNACLNPPSSCTASTITGANWAYNG